VGKKGMAMVQEGEGICNTARNKNYLVGGCSRRNGTKMGTGVKESEKRVLEGGEWGCGGKENQDPRGRGKGGL